MGPSPGSLFFSHCHRPRPPSPVALPPTLYPALQPCTLGQRDKHDVPLLNLLQALPTVSPRSLNATPGPVRPALPHLQPLCLPLPLPLPHQITLQLPTSTCSGSTARPPPAFLPLPGVPLPFLSGVSIEVLFKHTPLRSLHWPCPPSPPFL